MSYIAMSHELCCYELFCPGGLMKENALRIHPRDNVLVTLRDLAAGEEIVAQGVEGFRVHQSIPASHKVALRDIPAGEEIVKYGEIVAVTTGEIKKGEWVHTHNLESKRWKK